MKFVGKFIIFNSRYASTLSFRSSVELVFFLLSQNIYLGQPRTLILQNSICTSLTFLHRRHGIPCILNANKNSIFVFCKNSVKKEGRSTACEVLHHKSDNEVLYWLKYCPIVFACFWSFCPYNNTLLTHSISAL